MNRPRITRFHVIDFTREFEQRLRHIWSKGDRTSFKVVNGETGSIKKDANNKTEKVNLCDSSMPGDGQCRVEQGHLKQCHLEVKPKHLDPRASPEAKITVRAQAWANTNKAVGETNEK